MNSKIRELWQLFLNKEPEQSEPENAHVRSKLDVVLDNGDAMTAEGVVVVGYANAGHPNVTKSIFQCMTRSAKKQVYRVTIQTILEKVN
jgi:hypothetical protein